MCRQPRLDIAATFRRQFIVDEGMQLVFGDGNHGLGHCRCLSVAIIPLFSSTCPAGERRKSLCFVIGSSEFACAISFTILSVIISPAATPGARPRVTP